MRPLLLLASAATLVAAEPVTFLRDVAPILNKASCTSGPCHGAAKGKNGFKLSLRGYDPQFDYEALLYDLSGRRFNRADPGSQPDACQADAGGCHTAAACGLRRTPPITRSSTNGSRRVFRSAIRRKIASPVSRSNRKKSSCPSRARRPAVKVVAKFADGQTRDVTKEATVESNTPDVAKVDAAAESKRRAHRAKRRCWSAIRASSLQCR